MIDLILNDGSATPVARTFNRVIPYGGPKRNAVWQYRTSGPSFSWFRVEYGLRRSDQKAAKTSFKVIVPWHVTSATGAVTLGGQCIFDSNSGFTIPEDAPLEYIKHLYAFVGSLIDLTAFKAAVIDGDITFAL